MAPCGSQPGRDLHAVRQDSGVRDAPFRQFYTHLSLQKKDLSGCGAGDLRQQSAHLCPALLTQSFA